MILLYARDEIKVGRLTIGSFGAFTFALFKAYEPIKRIGTVYQLFLQAARDFRRRYLRSSTCPRKRWKPRSESFAAHFERSIEFDNVSFAYEEAADSERH